MGASKEGGMSVREKIDLVLRENSLYDEDDDDDPDSSLGSREGNDNSNSGSPTSSLTSSSIPTATTLTPNLKVNVSLGGPSSSGRRTSAGKPAAGGDGREGGSWLPLLDNSDSSSGSEVLGGGVRLISSNWLDSNGQLQRLLFNHLNIISDLNERLSKEKARAENLEKELSKFQTTAISQRNELDTLLQEKVKLEERNLKHEATIREKDTKIEHLEQRLRRISESKKSLVHKETLTSPLRYSPSNTPEGWERLVDGRSDFYLNKRRKLEDLEVPTGSLRTPKPNNVLSSFTHSYQGRSESPPQLSPAVTPKSSNSKFKPFHRRDLLEYSEDVDDGLHTINFYNKLKKEERNRSHIIPPKRLLQSNPSAFSKPTQHSRVIHSTSRNSIKSLQSFRESHQQATPSTSFKSDGNDALKNSFFSRDPPYLVGIRNNNFLNMTKPVPRRPPIPFSPTTAYISPQGLSSDELFSRTLDSSVQSLPEATGSGSAPPVVKKRGVGRPPGSRPRKRLPAANSPSSATNLGSSGSRYANGLEEFVPKPESPPRFSKRGRLLKPNRARYSPDPDTSSHAREKFQMTKKNYFTNEPCVPEGCVPVLEANLSTALVPLVEGADLPCKKEVEKISPPEAAPEQEGATKKAEEVVPVVEVPQWRIVECNGFEDEEERIPPDDDMSEDAFLKRHQKPEVQEKQRKRWDMQMLREESYKERMQRKQEERERQKELRRQQRKRKGRSGANEEEIVHPGTEEIKALYISEDLPVGAFGQTLPINEKVDFEFASRCALSTSTPSPPKYVITISTNKNTPDDVKFSDGDDITNSSNSRDADVSEFTSVVNDLAKEARERGISESEVTSVENKPEEDIPETSSASPGTSSSFRMQSSSFQEAETSPTPPPPVIYCMRDNNNDDVYEYNEEDEEILSAPALTTHSPILDLEGDALPLDKDTVDTISNKPTSPLKDGFPELRPSITIPLSVPVIRGRRSSGKTVSFSPMSGDGDSDQPSTSSTKGTSINFCIPNNPLVRSKPKKYSNDPASSPIISSSDMTLEEDKNSKDRNVRR